MTKECVRCGRSEDNDATLVEDVEGREVLCIVCVDGLQEKGRGTRHVDQAALEEFKDEA